MMMIYIKWVWKVKKLVSQTIYFNSKEQTKSILFKVIDPKFNARPITLCHIFIHRWKDSPGILLSSVKPPDGLRAFITGLLDTRRKEKSQHQGKRKKNQDQGKRVVVPVGRCCSRSNTHTQSRYFLDTLKPSVIIFQTVLFHLQLICNYSNSQSTIATHHLPYLIFVDFSPF